MKAKNKAGETIMDACYYTTMEGSFVSKSRVIEYCWLEKSATDLYKHCQNNPKYDIKLVIM